MLGEDFGVVRYAGTGSVLAGVILWSGGMGRGVAGEDVLEQLG